jgi:hypothetical protein
MQDNELRDIEEGDREQEEDRCDTCGFMVTLCVCCQECDEESD